jgi:serine O-acetyltransferase
MVLDARPEDGAALPSGPVGRLQRFGRALVKAASAVRSDHEHMVAMQSKYAGREGAPLAADLVTKIGFQMMTAYRVMRLFEEAEVPVVPKIAARMIRHLYGSDIHWEASFEPGVMIVHGMGLAISHAARVESGVILNQNVTLGASVDPVTRVSGAPHLEQNVHVGAGATLIGPITIGAGSKIMPGCVVTRSVPPNSVVESPTPNVRSRKSGG